MSVDYDFGIQGLTTEGFRDKDDDLWRFKRWTKVDDKVEYPKILHKLVGKYPTVNCEFIGGNLIEVHLRANEEMGDYDEIIPVWKDDPLDLKLGYDYVDHPDYHGRVGFFKKRF